MLQQPIFSSTMLIDFVRQRKDLGSCEKQLLFMLSNILYCHHQWPCALLISPQRYAVDNNVVVSNTRMSDSTVIVNPTSSHTRNSTA